MGNILENTVELHPSHNLTLHTAINLVCSISFTFKVFKFWHSWFYSKAMCWFDTLRNILFCSSPILLKLLFVFEPQIFELWFIMQQKKNIENWIFSYLLSLGTTPIARFSFPVSSFTPFLFYKNSFYKSHEAENRPKIKNFVRITLGSRSRDL